MNHSKILAEWRLFYPQVREISLEQSIEATGKFLTQTLDSAYEEGQRDALKKVLEVLDERLEKLVKDKYNEEVIRIGSVELMLLKQEIIQKLIKD